MFGCEAQLSRKRSVVRDEGLRAALAAVAPTPQHQWMWVRGTSEVRLSPPDNNDTRAYPFGQASNSADAPLPSRPRELMMASVDSTNTAGKRCVSDQQDSRGSPARAPAAAAAAAAAAKRLRPTVRENPGMVVKREAAEGTDGEGWAVAQGVVQEAEGLQLHLKAQSSTRYRGISFISELKSFKATAGKVHLGYFATAVEAAVCYARHVQQTQLEAMEEEENDEVEECTANDAVAQARAEGLQLEQSTSASGYKGVKVASKNSSRYEARVQGVDGRVHLGSFTTAEEAALAVARAEARTQAPAEAEEPLPSVTWAQCETCDKWRKLPHLAEDQVPDKWHCHMNLDSLHNACNLPEEEEEEEERAEQEPEQEPAVKVRAPSCRAAGPNRTSNFHSPCVHCGVPLHLRRKECSCGRPNRCYVHRDRVVRLNLSVGEGGSVRVALIRASSDAPDSVSHSVVVRLSLKVGEGGSVRAEMLLKSSEQDNHTAEGPVLRKRKHFSQSEPTAADDVDAKRRRGSSAASSSALAVAHEEDDDTEFNSSELEKEAPGWHDACTWVQCDRCQKWRRWLHSNDEPPDKWWCQLNDDVRNGPRTSMTKVPVGATETYEVHLDSTLIAGELRRLRGP